MSAYCSFIYFNLGIYFTVSENYFRLLSIPRALQGTTTTKLKQLFDNYEPDTGRAEVVTAYERDEDNAFLDAVMSTQVMAKTKKFLTDKSNILIFSYHYFNLLLFL